MKSYIDQGKSYQNAVDRTIQQAECSQYRSERKNGLGMSYMSDKVFFDTNGLVYAFDKNEPDKRAVARELIGDFGGEGNLVLSTQVLQEFYVTFY